ncbi:MAG TPA: phosphatidylinositol-specific phospholipase C/glycerophosphodiester phosphodiesterase family protein [bacterium]|nr:phosphatidylinositol-specific phospholipase C/glycerophosphodiester phosphodiesterase family protein [bacterium]
MRRLGLLILAVLLSGEISAAAPSPSVVPLARAHAHNDYEHARPLLDALERGFTSVEADIWLVGGDLLVAHDLAAARPERTLKALYLDPLRRIVQQNGGRVYAGYGYAFQLLIDIKSDAAATYRALHEQLRGYEPMLTLFTPTATRAGPILVVISGNRPREIMMGQTLRYAGYDGRVTDLGALAASKSFMPLVSDNWALQFRWGGLGPMPDDERGKLKSIIDRAHVRGQRVRFWATPDAPGAATEAVWLELLRAGVDYINTDQLDALREFLLRADATPSVPPVR